MNDQQRPHAANSDNRSVWTPTRSPHILPKYRAWPSGRAYLLSFVAALFLCAAGFSAVLTLLSAAQRLPAPPVSGTWCIDEKLAWLKENPEVFASNVVAVGSSVTWRNLDFSVLSPAARTAVGGTVNAAPCFLRANQTRFMTHYLLGRRPEIHTIMVVLNPRDMEVCSTTPSAFFEPAVADSYFAGYLPGWWIYFRNFRPASFYRDIVRRPRVQRELVFDQFGSGPLTNNKPQQLWFPFRPETSCYRELRSLATELREKDVQLVVATLPVMPEWAKHYDADGVTQRDFLKDVQAAVAETGAILVDGQRSTSSLPKPLLTQLIFSGLRLPISRALSGKRRVALGPSSLHQISKALSRQKAR